MEGLHSPRCAWGGRSAGRARGGHSARCARSDHSARCAWGGRCHQWSARSTYRCVRRARGGHSARCARSDHSARCAWGGHCHQWSARSTYRCVRCARGNCGRMRRCRVGDHWWLRRTRAQSPQLRCARTRRCRPPRSLRVSKGSQQRCTRIGRRWPPRHLRIGNDDRLRCARIGRNLLSRGPWATGCAPHHCLGVPAQSLHGLAVTFPARPRNSLRTGRLMQACAGIPSTESGTV
mmetsp:Transcript_68735/g.178508  ORF Transcript_68735/g.178508 Transcript_68735/m.178508 type:complete len:235 (-) Transcript_68735:263-967(-)